MNLPNFEKMSLKELKAYFLAHRDDRDAFYAYIDKLHAEGNWVEMPPVNSVEELTNYPDFVEHSHNNSED